MRKVILFMGSFLTAAMLSTTLSTRPLTSFQQEKHDSWMQWTPSGPWKPNDRNRPLPAIITPGTVSAQTHGDAPSDAIRLFDGKDLSNWESLEGGPAKWVVAKGYFMVRPGTGYIRTKDAYGDCQLHVEWATPNPPHGKDQARGNSGVFLQGLYEIQVLDSYENITYADGEAGAVYGQYPPLVNASRKPGEWQTYDIVFHGARFDAEGKLTRRATVTLFWNGVLVQDHVEIKGQNADHVRPPYTAMPERLPLELQDHNDPVRYRNIWLRELKEGD